MRIARAGTLAAAALAAAALGTGCSSSLGPAPETLEEARERWEERGPVHYTYEYRLVCFCAGPGVPPVRIEVRDGEVVAVSPTTEERGPDFPLEEYPTVEDLFVRMEEALARDPFELVRFEFHADLGHPVDVFIDFVENAIDEEWGFRVSDLEAASGAS